MEPDPLPESSGLQLDTKITNKDIDEILGVPKRGKQQKILYLLSKKVIVVVASVTTFIFFSAHYLGLV